jgi:putative SOS response-associated peptidase YedK
MCGRFTLTANPEDIQQAFNLTTAPSNIEPRYNVAPTQPVAVITNDDPKSLTYLRWGLVPSWSKDIKIGAKLINARSEEAYEKPSFRSAFKRRRCLIPTNGFYEWQKEGKGKTPHFIHMRGGELFAFAGLWEIWHSPDGDELRTCTILTTSANTLIEPLHNRMPVILRPQDYSIWLEKGEQPTEVLMPLMKQFDPNAMEEYVVSTAVNHAMVDSPDMVERAS